MENSTHITTIEVDDPRNPGQIISLAIHELPGGVIGLDTSYLESVANYIIDPYDDCKFVKLTDPQGNDDVPDPPLSEDPLVGFMLLANAIDTLITKMDPERRPAFIEGMAKVSGLGTDRIEFLFGTAKETLEGLKLDE